MRLLRIALVLSLAFVPSVASAELIHRRPVRIRGPAQATDRALVNAKKWCDS
jgi:hypothetical protein